MLDGQKKWIGNASFADLVIIWARDVETDRVLGFVVEKGTPGFSAVDLEDKIALRAVQNALITLDDVRVPEENRLQEANSFRDTANVLKMTRAGVAWSAVGCAPRRLRARAAYAKERSQFGQPIVEFQLVQDLLVRMLGNITASAAMCARLSQLQDAGRMTDEHASLAKAFCTVRMRETVGWARELMGGNGILLENNVGRYVADAEAIYSYEGTREVNTLIVGRAITGTGPSSDDSRAGVAASAPSPPTTDGGLLGGASPSSSTAGSADEVVGGQPRADLVERVRRSSPQRSSTACGPAGRRSRAAAGPGRPPAA